MIVITENYDELEAKNKQIKNLELQLGVKDRLISELLRDKKIYLNRSLLSESEIKPVRNALNALTSEKSRWLRKEKRLSN
jgi:hypothetical protein